MPSGVRSCADSGFPGRRATPSPAAAGPPMPPIHLCRRHPPCRAAITAIDAPKTVSAIAGVQSSAVPGALHEVWAERSRSRSRPVRGLSRETPGRRSAQGQSTQGGRHQARQGSEGPPGRIPARAPACRGTRRAGRLRPVRPASVRAGPAPVRRLRRAPAPEGPRAIRPGPLTGSALWREKRQRQETPGQAQEP